METNTNYELITNLLIIYMEPKNRNQYSRWMLNRNLNPLQAKELQAGLMSEWRKLKLYSSFISLFTLTFLDNME